MTTWKRAGLVAGAALVGFWLSAGCGSSSSSDHCTNGVKDGSETDVDCGGSCKPCALTRACSVPADCSPNTCAAGTCQTTLGCGALLSCLSACTDAACQTTCLARAGTTATSLYDALGVCVETACPTTPGGACANVGSPTCNACIQASVQGGGPCNAALVACQAN